MSIDKKAFKKAIENDRSFQPYLAQIKPNTVDKEFSISLLNQVVEVLKDKKETGTHKFYALRLLTDCIQTYKVAMVNVIANAKEFHEVLQNYALFQKEARDDGATIFGKKEMPIIGIEFLQLVLETIMSLGKKYPQDSKGNATRLFKLYSELEDKGIKFPQQFQFFPQPAQDKTLAQTQAPSKPKPEVQKPLAQSQLQPAIQQQKQTPEPDPKELKMRYMRMFESVLEDAQLLEGTLKESEEPEEFIQDILGSYNKTFLNQKKMLDKLIQESAQFENLFSEPESAKMFQLRDFMESYSSQFTEMEQTGFLEDSYKSFKFIILQQVAELQGKSQPRATPPVVKPKQQSQQLPPKEEYRAPPKDEYKAPPKDDYRAPNPTPKQQQEYKPPVKEQYESKPQPKQSYTPREDREPSPRQPEYRQTQSQYKPQQQDQSLISQLTGQPSNLRKQDSFNPTVTKQTSTPLPQPYLQNTNSFKNSGISPVKFSTSQYSQQPPLQETNSGYFYKENDKIINQSSTNTAPQQQRSVSPIRKQLQGLAKSRVEDFPERFDALSMSTMSVRDFPSKNQQTIDDKSYYGYLVPYDGRQFNQLYQQGLSDNQIRRLKVACIKQQASIFESSQLQIGIISKLILHEMTNRYFLKMNIVFGNKTKHPMLNCQITYEGDYGLSIWTQDAYLDKKQGLPKNEDGQIDLAVKQQLYQPVVLHYNSIPFNSINGHFQWQDEQNQLKAPFVLPCMIPKFMKFLETDPVVFKQKWHYKKQQCLKSELVQLNSKIIRQPIFFKRYFPELVELSSLSDFVNQQQDQNGNFKDFKLGGTFSLQSPQIEFMLKIIVRPNLTGIFKIIPYFSYQSQAEHILHNLVFLFGHPN